MRALRWLPFSIAAALFAALPLPAAPAADEQLAEDDRVSELERKVELLTEELARTRQDMAVPEESTELESKWGMGPGASRIYGIARGLSIGGYAEGLYTAVVHDKRRSGEVNSADFTRAVLYTGYKFTDRILFNAEIEFEHATTEATATNDEGGSVSVEFATLDFLIHDELNARGGLVLMPVGFLNEMHEPPFYYGTHRPDVEQTLIPSTWREYGGGLFGRIFDQFEYKVYVVTSMNADGFEPSGIREGRQQGSEALAEDLAFVGRLDWEATPELLIGGALFVGNTGQDQKFDIDGDGDVDVALPDALLKLWELHAEFAMGGLRTRGLFTASHLDEAGALSNALVANGTLPTGAGIGRHTIGGYGEIAYEVLQWIAPDSGWTLEPFVRAEYIDTQYDMPSGIAADKTQKVEVYTVGMQAKPHPNVVLKLDYRNRSSRDGELGDEVNVGLGVVF